MEPAEASSEELANLNGSDSSPEEQTLNESADLIPLPESPKPEPKPASPAVTEVHIERHVLATITLHADIYSSAKVRLGQLLYDHFTRDQKLSIVVEEREDQHTLLITHNPRPNPKNGGFQIDTTPCTPIVQERPRYQNGRKRLADGDAYNAVSCRNRCFNCGGEHSLKECEQPLDQRRIKRARESLRQKQERYHQESAADMRFGHLRPGQMSSGLREALGLAPNSIPTHIIKMRQFGYPPGWLETARMRGSGLAMFDSKSNARLKEGVVFDVGRIIDFPGFNVSTARENETSRPLPIENPHSKARMVYVLEQLAAECNGKTATAAATTEEETKESTEKNKKEASPAKDPKPDSPSMDDLRSQQADLLKELHDSLEDGDNGAETTTKDAIDMDVSGDETTASADTSLMTRSSTLAVVPGTPLITACSPWSKLPAGEKWSVGVSDVIAFENLPDSTGKYENIRGVVAKVRKVLNSVDKR